MRVELLQHATNGVLDKLVLVDAVDIEIGNGYLCPAQLLYRAVLAHSDAHLGTGRSYCQECYQCKQ